MPSILMVVQRYLPAIGGVEKHVSSVVSKLRKRGFRTDILTTSHEAGLPRMESNESGTIKRFPPGYEKCPPLIWIWMLHNWRIFMKYDLVHIHDPYPLIAWYLPLRLLNLLTPTHITFHGYESDPVPAFMRVLRRFAKRLVGSTLCIGSFISVVYDIVCTSSTLGAVELDCGISRERSGTIYVGRLEEDTGITGYIQAFNELSDDRDSKMRICGGGFLKPQLEEISKDVSADIEFKGYIDNPQKVMSESKVMLAGGFLSILEGMACGLPVIAYARTHLKWQYYKSVLDEGGPISIQTTPSGVASQIRRLLSDDELWLKISEEGKRFAAQWTWDRMADLYLRNWGIS